jgi:hypothetical protein
METKKLTDEIIAKLKAPLPEAAVGTHPTRKYLSAIKAIYIVERLNEVFGVNGWKQTLVEGHTRITAGGVDKKGEPTPPMVVLLTRLKIPEYGIEHEAFGGNDNEDLGDAFKGAMTDSLTKMASYMYIGMDVYKGLSNGATAPAKTADKPAQSAQKSTVTESGNQISFKLAEWNEMDGQYGPILVLKWWGKQGLEEKRLFKNTKNASYFEHLKDLVGNTLTFSTEKKGNYTNLKDLVAVDGVPYIKPNGTPPLAPKDPTHITNEDIAF